MQLTKLLAVQGVDCLAQASATLLEFLGGDTLAWQQRRRQRHRRRRHSAVATVASAAAAAAATAAAFLSQSVAGVGARGVLLCRAGRLGRAEGEAQLQYQ